MILNHKFYREYSQGVYLFESKTTPSPLNRVGEGRRRGGYLLTSYGGNYQQGEDKKGKIIKKRRMRNDGKTKSDRLKYLKNGENKGKYIPYLRN
jgi:hypothetical protein